jgi:hypothetical protein
MTETSLIVQEPGIFKGLTTETANTLKAAFEPFKAQVEEWQANAAKINVTDESQVTLMKEAGIARKAVKNIRIAIEHKRKELKEDSLKKGQVIDKIANGFKSILEKLESNLQQQEDFAKIQETARINKAHSERFAILNGLGYSYQGNDLGTMQPDVFNGLVTIAEQQRPPVRRRPAGQRSRLRLMLKTSDWLMSKRKQSVSALTKRMRSCALKMRLWRGNWQRKKKSATD